MKSSKNNYSLIESNPKPALAPRLKRWFVLLLLALGAGGTANAQLVATNGNFSNVTGLTYSGGWYGGTTLPVGWSAPYFSGGDDPYMVYNPSSGNYYFNMSTTGDVVQQTVGTVTNNTPVILTFDSSTVFEGGTSLEAFILDSSDNILASNTFSSGLGQQLVASNVAAGTTVQIYFDDTVNDVGLANVSVQSFDAITPPQITQQPAPTNYVRPPPDDVSTTATLSVAAYGYLPLSYQWLSNSVPVSGATNATMAAGNAGSYTVVVTGANNLSVTSSVAMVIQAPQLGVINGNFSDLTGMTSIGGGWYGYAVPHEWSMTDSPNEYEVYNPGGGYTCNVDNLGFVTQYVGQLTNTTDVILSFDNNAVFGGSQLGVAILSSSNSSYTVIAQNDFSTGLGQQLVASNVPAGTDISIEFWSAENNPGLANVVLNPATIAVASSLNPSTYGGAVTFTATATAPGGTPTGTITFEDGATILGSSTLVGGTATLTTSGIPAGSSQTITAVYSGDNYFGIGTGTLPGGQTVNPRVVTLSGSMTYDGEANIAGANLTVANNLDGANLTVSGALALAGDSAGSEAILFQQNTAPTLVQSASGNSGSSASTTIPVTLTTAPVNGNTLIAVISTRGTALDEVTSITQTGATWTRAVASAADTHGTTTEIWYAPNVSGAGTSVTINQASLESAAVIMEYSGVLTASPLDQTKSNTGGSTTSATTGTTSTTTQAAELWIGGIGLVNSGYTLASPLNSFTSVNSAASTSATATANAVVYALAYQATATGTASSGGTVNTASYWSGAIATFKQAGVILGGSAAGNYTLTGTTGGSVTVTPKAVTMSGLTVPSSKVYDGTTTAVVSGTPALASAEAVGAGTTSDGKPYTGDTVSITGSASGTYNSPNVGATTVTFSGLSLTGAQSGDYTLTQQTAASATITPRVVTLSGSGTYNGTATMASANLSIGNNLDGGNLTLASGSAALAAKSVGSEAINYYATPTLVQSAPGNSGSSASTTIPVTLGTAPVNGDTMIAVISTRGTTSTEVTSITQTGATWTRAIADNDTTHDTTIEIWYAPNVSGAGTSVTITQASLESAAVVMEYSGVLTASPLDQTKDTTSGGTQSTSATTGTTTTTTQANELWIGGIGLVNSSYTLGTILDSFTTVNSAASTSATATANAVVYALAYQATATGTASSGGTVNTASYWSGAVATFKAAVAGSLMLGGSAAGNYTAVGASGSVTVTAKTLTMSGLSVPASKPYDGTTTAVVSGTPALQTAEAGGTGSTSDGKPYTGDTVSLTGTASGTYNSSSVASAATVTFTGLSLTGAQSSDYSLTIQSPASATITPVTLTYNATSANQAYGSANTVFSGNVTGFVPGDNLGNATTGSATFTSMTMTTSPVGSYAITGAGLMADNGNYNFVQAGGNPTALTVTPLPVILTGTEPYTGNATAAAAVLSVANLVSPDTSATVNVNTGGGSVTLTSANAGSEAIIGGTGSLTLTQPAANNYTLAGATGSVTITAASNPPFSFTNSASLQIIGGVTNLVVTWQSVSGTTYNVLTNSQYEALPGSWVDVGSASTPTSPVTASGSTTTVSIPVPGNANVFVEIKQ